MTTPGAFQDVLSRNEYERDVTRPETADEQEIQLSALERVWNITAVRKLTLLATMALIWQVYALALGNDLMLPTFTASLEALWETTVSLELPAAIGVSLRVLALSYAAGVVASGVITLFALSSRIGSDFLEVCTGMFNLLPAIALLPLALLWFGLGYPSIMFVIIHSVTWPMTLNISSGFNGVSKTLRMAGRNLELRGLAYVFRLLVPAALPSILTGLRVGWAFSWRTLIAAELVFGVSSGSGGIGWFIYEKKNQLDITAVFAGLIAIIVIGVIVENILFTFIEKRTVRKWGMKH